VDNKNQGEDNRSKLFVGALQSFFESTAWWYFGLLCVGSLLAMYIQSELILTDEVYYNTLGEQLTLERIKQVLDAQKKYVWIGYVLVPLMIVIQAFLITLCLNVGVILLDWKIPFRKLYGIVIKSSVTFLLYKLVIIFVLLMVDVDKVEDMMKADKFSLLSLLGQNSVPKWMYYPFQTVNVFEIIFVVLLGYGISYLKDEEKPRIGFVLSTYGVGLIFWVLFVVFIMINIGI
jgi:hypothetical protein